MRKILRFIFWALVALSLYSFMFRSADIVAGLAPNDKFDQQCTGLETVGRCTDKCPSDQYLQGYDKDTGAAICKPNNLTDPSESNASQTPASDTLAVNPPAAEANAPDFQGK